MGEREDGLRGGGEGFICGGLLDIGLRLPRESNRDYRSLYSGCRGDGGIVHDDGTVN